MIAKSIDQITEAVLQSLIDNSVVENKTIEYKQELPGNSDDDKKEFLADVSSFANASGGDLIFGVIEDRETGFPERLEGLEIANVDQEKLRLDTLIRNGIEPRIWGITFRGIDLQNSRKALIIRIPKSWRSPHRVSFKGRGHGKFFLRSANGKHPMDVEELRIAFNLSETITERIRNFRVDRIAKIFADETPVPLCFDSAKIVLHLIPIGSFNPAQSYNIGEIASDHVKVMIQIADHGVNFNESRYNFDGFLTCYPVKKDKAPSYVQLFNNGIIEAVDSELLHQNKKIPITTLEIKVINFVNSYLSILKILNVELPIFVFLTLSGVRGYSMSETKYWPAVYEIDRETLLLPETLIESFDDKIKTVLRPCFNSIWRACGLRRSLNYDDEGNWIER